ncbi:hypothetical protein VT84_07275 [Gemmata sp. SH-PL17]|uniref:hypothetical protein n=1 Tax=Gemmata sp. SH-PL17 TaxID=1630693 RepID=UPI00078B7B58|nr:hypothetical protein [Gemmata sp. SH-PL17]AMV24181.1 hypothetical protein VT84_07275 [Gemmata sp. SH-PL17]
MPDYNVGQPYLRLFTLSSDWKRRGFALAPLFDHPGMSATHWGEDDPPELPFSVKDYLDYWNSHAEPIGPIERKSHPTWNGGYGPGGVWINMDANVTAQDHANFFDWSVSLADAIGPEYGVCNYLLRSSTNDTIHRNRSWSITVTNFATYGPPWFGARTFLGSRLIERIGRERLEAVKGTIYDRPWGVILDLDVNLAHPDPDQLASAQSAAMAILLSSGVFGDYSDRANPQPGPTWQSIDHSIILK